MDHNICFNWQSLITEIKIRRKEQRFTQEQLAILCGVSKPTLNNLEQGKTNITVANVIKITQCLGIKIN